MDRNRKPLPVFESEADERAFWETHEFHGLCGLVGGRARPLPQHYANGH